MGFGGTVPLGVLVGGLGDPRHVDHRSTSRRRGLGSRARRVVECAALHSERGTGCLTFDLIAYRGVRGAVRQLVDRHRRRGRSIRVAPATPEWRGHDVLAHMVGVTDDVVHGRMDGIASDPWTQAQVDARGGSRRPESARRVGRVLGPQFEELLAMPREIAGQAIFDAATHEHDLRNAARPARRARHRRASSCGWDWIVGLRTVTGARAVASSWKRDEQVSGVGDL